MFVPDVHLFKCCYMFVSCLFDLKEIQHVIKKNGGVSLCHVTPFTYNSRLHYIHINIYIYICNIVDYSILHCSS